MSEYDAALEYVKDGIGYSDDTDARLALDNVLGYPYLRELLVEAGILVCRGGGVEYESPLDGPSKYIALGFEARNWNGREFDVYECVVVVPDIPQTEKR